MTTPANLTFQDIQTRVANQLRIPTTNTTEMAKIAAVINEVYRDMAAKQDWQWLLKRTSINVTPKISATASLTLNSVTGTLSTAPGQNGSDVSIANFLLYPASTPSDPNAFYRVSSTHSASQTGIVLDGGFTQVTSTATSVTLYQDSYPLPADCGKVINIRRFGRSSPLRRVGIEEISWLKLADRTEGPPECYSVFDNVVTGDPSSSRMLQIHPFPDSNYHRLEIFYKQTLNTELSGTTQPFIPDDFRQVLVYGALSRCYPIFMNDVDRGRYFQTLFNDMMALMSAQNKEYAVDRPGVAPDGNYRRHRMPGSGYSLGSYFDRWPSNP